MVEFGVRAIGDTVCRERRISCYSQLRAHPQYALGMRWVDCSIIQTLDEAELGPARLSGSMTSIPVYVFMEWLRCNDRFGCMMRMC